MGGDGNHLRAMLRSEDAPGLEAVDRMLVEAAIALFGLRDGGGKSCIGDVGAMSRTLRPVTTSAGALRAAAEFR